MQTVNLIGIVSAAATFLGVWLGHVAVRKIEYLSANLRLPVLLSATLGLALEWGSLVAESQMLSAALGILGVTVLWDALEFIRQEKRVAKGHSPANPRNSRHARILACHPSAASLDRLDRQPPDFLLPDP